MFHNGKYYKKTLKRNEVMPRNIASMLQSKVFRANDSSNTVLNNNQVIYNNPTSVVKTNSSEKEITNAEEQQKTVQMTVEGKLYRYLKISIPWKMLVNQILIFQIVLILPNNYCLANHNLPQPLM